MAQTQMTLDQFFTDNPEWRPFADILAVPPTAEEIREEFPDADREVLEKCMSGTQVAVGSLYVRMRREGSDDRWAAMLALRQFPGVETTDTFWAGRKHFSEVYGEEYANGVRTLLAKRGVNLKAGDEYCPELARFKGDPQAVLPFDGARDRIRKVAERLGTGCEGAVSVKARGPDVDPDSKTVPLAEDLIRANARRMIAKNPDLQRLSRRELRQAVLAKHGPTK